MATAAPQKTNTADYLLANEALPYDEYVKLFRYEDIVHPASCSASGDTTPVPIRQKIDNRTAAQKKAFRMMHKMSHPGFLRKIDAHRTQAAIDQWNAERVSKQQ
jgi:hypothetical protein